MLARVARLSPEARGVLDVSAVIGTHVSADLLVDIAGPVLEAMDECIARGLCIPSNDGLAFRHELVRDAVLERISAPRRRLLHQRVLSALLANAHTASDFARIAHHAEEAGDREATRASATAAARQASALFSHREAAAQYARVLRVSGDLPDDERARLLESYSYACYLSSQGEESIESGRRAIEIWRRVGNRLEEGNSERWLSRVLWFQGQNVEARTAGLRAVALLEALPPSPQLAMAYSNMSQLEMLRFDYDETLFWGEKAIELADRFDEHETLVHALINVGTVRAMRSDSEGWSMLERAHRLASDAGMIDHAQRALVNRAWTLMMLFRLHEADDVFETAIHYAAEHDLDNYFWYVTSARAMLRTYFGQWDESLRAIASVLSAPAISAVTRIVAHTVRGTILSRRGDGDARASLDEALELSEETGEIQRLGPIRIARAEAAWLEGDSPRSAAEARAIEEMAGQVGTPWIRGAIAFVLHRAGEPFISIEGLPEPYALMISGDWLEAAQGWGEIGCVYERACALAQSDDEPSVHEAVMIFESLGADPATAWAHRRLRALGVRPVHRGPRASTRANPAGLTHREVDVLHLLREGLTNSEIAERLFISPKTAGHHVSAILAKLGVESRTAAATHAVQIDQSSPLK